MFEYPSFGKIINTIHFTSNQGYDTVILYFEHKIITLYAYGECCSTSRFVIYDYYLATIIGKTILRICVCETNNEPNNGIFLRTTPIKIIFDDLLEFEFELHNVSNGYYRGWMEIKEGIPDNFNINNS